MIACIVPSMSFAITHSFQHIFFFAILVPSRDGRRSEAEAPEHTVDKQKSSASRKISNARKLFGWIAAERLGCGWQTLEALASHHWMRKDSRRRRFEGKGRRRNGLWTVKRTTQPLVPRRWKSVCWLN